MRGWIHCNASTSAEASAEKALPACGHQGRFQPSGRRTFASKVLAITGDMDTVAQLLGHTSIDCSQRYVDVCRATLQAMFADAI